MNSNPIFNMHIPTKLVFGCGEIKKLATEKLPGKKAMIVISSGTSMKKYGYLDKVINLLTENDTASIVYDKILPNPIKSHVMEAAAICRERGCDFIVGLGGGSSIDSAKAIAVMACNDGDYWDYIQGGTGKGRPVKKVLPVVAIPTTAGTGTEADPWTVITNEERQEKIGFGCPGTFPALSIIDPELMVSIPPHLTAYQGFDAFFHAAEGFIANCSTPISDLYALEAIRLLYKLHISGCRPGIQAEIDGCRDNRECSRVGILHNGKALLLIPIGMDGIHGVQKAIHMDASCYQNRNCCPPERCHKLGKSQPAAEPEPAPKGQPLHNAYQRKKAEHMLHPFPFPLHTGQGNPGVHGQRNDASVKQLHSSSPFKITGIPKTTSVTRSAHAASS